MVKTKKPNPTDMHVGARVRMARLMIGMSQEKLGDALGLTFQQVQKYEKGTNRIGSSRLAQISIIVGMPIAFFFAQDGAGVMSTMDILTTNDGLRLARAFMAIDSIKIKRSLVTLVELLGEGP